VADIYSRGISTGSMSKAFSLAGLRLGWAVATEELTHRLSIHRDYTTISVGMVDDLLSALALEHADAILERNRALTRVNLELLSNWVADESRISWVTPRGGTTALLKFDLPMSSRDFCVGLLEDCGVMLTPGSVMGMEGYLRIGYANSTQVLSQGLALMSRFIEKQVHAATR
jgi:aspartate/methionine/tyrosine aminotransferase